MFNWNKQAKQADIAAIVGVTQPSVSVLIAEGKIPKVGTLQEVVHAYCARLREQAAGRMGADGEEGGALDLVQERAALAREQRIGHEIKNAISRGEYAPIGALADVLGMASSAVVDRLDQLDGTLRKACPDLPEDARETVLKIIASARNEWVRSTAKLVIEQLEDMEYDDDGEGDA